MFDAPLKPGDRRKFRRPSDGKEFWCTIINSSINYWDKKTVEYGVKIDAEGFCLLGLCTKKHSELYV